MAKSPGPLAALSRRSLVPAVTLYLVGFALIYLGWPEGWSLAKGAAFVIGYALAAGSGNAAFREYLVARRTDSLLARGEHKLRVSDDLAERQAAVRKHFAENPPLVGGSMTPEEYVARADGVVWPPSPGMQKAEEDGIR